MHKLSARPFVLRRSESGAHARSSHQPPLAHPQKKYDIGVVASGLRETSSSTVLGRPFVSGSEAVPGVFNVSTG